MTRTTIRTTIALFFLITGLALQLPAQTGPEFVVSISPSIVTITQGGMTSFTVNIAVNERPTFELNLSGLPSGVIAQVPAGRAGATTIVLNALPSAATGSFTVDLTALAGGLSPARAGNVAQTQSFVLNVKPMPVVQWEYRVEVTRTQQELEDMAGSLGTQSWELVSVVLHEHNGTPEWVGFFKRQKH
ncbi:MAG: hypothetical protein LAO20_09695 [Acidobacteriia bacterium]|nr:hypothetical protein [Terriglobia bacterium]